MVSTVSSIDTGHDDMIHDAQMDYYGKRLATCSSDRLIKLFDISGDTQTPIADLRGHEGPVWEVAWAHPKFGNLLASCSYDKKVIIWKETASGWEIVYENHDHASSVNSVSWAPHEYGKPILACASSDGDISVIELIDGNWVSTKFNAHPTGVTSVSWGPAVHGATLSQPNPQLLPRRLVSGGCDHLARIWKFEDDTWKSTDQLEGHTNWVRDVAWAATLGVSTGTIATCSQDEYVFIWTQDKTSASEKWEKKELKKFACPVWRVSWSLTGNILAVASADNKVTLWKESLDGEWNCVSEVDE